MLLIFMCVNETEWPYICAEMPLRNTHQLTPLVVDKEQPCSCQLLHK